MPYPVSFTSEEIVAMLYDAHREWGCAIRIKISAGSGCTVMEIFDRDATEPSVPMQRTLLKAA
jgi:hypothetical protein